MINRKKALKDFVSMSNSSLDPHIETLLDSGFTIQQTRDDLLETFDKIHEDLFEGSRTFVEILLDRCNPPSGVTDDELEQHMLNESELSQFRQEQYNYITNVNM